MPRTTGNASSAAEPVEPEKPVESDERVDLDEDDDPEELMDEEFEYEEIEEEEVEEVEEGEEEVEEVEDEEEEEELEEEDNTNNVNGADETKVKNEDENKKHAELLARPPHGSEVYVGGIPHDASEEDLKGFCESVGEVTEVGFTDIYKIISLHDFCKDKDYDQILLQQVRIMKGKNSSENKGFAFVTFRSVDLASKAIDELNNTELKVHAVLLNHFHVAYSSH